MVVMDERTITGRTRVFGVIADPIAHVRAPLVFNAEFKARGLDSVLVPFHISASGLEGALRGLALMPNMGGVCVTIPHKLAAAGLCDALGLTAEITGAVNAIRFEDGRLIGDNFDGEGFVAGVYGEGHRLKDKNVLLLGAGGAGRAIAVGLLEGREGQVLKSLTIANRTRHKADWLVALAKEHFPNRAVKAIDMADVEAHIGEQNIIINTTSLGLSVGDALPCSVSSMGSEVLVADIIMEPSRTAWLEAAEKRGLKTHAGRYMLDYQKDLIGRFIGAL